MKMTVLPSAIRAAACVLLFSAGSGFGTAQAEEWSLNVCNPDLQVGGICPAIGKVSATTTNGSIKVTVSTTDNYRLWSNGVFAFNWGGPTPVTAVLTGWTGALGTYTVDKVDGLQNLDGFGKFNYAWDLNIAALESEAQGPQLLTFTLTGNVSLAYFVANANGSLFAAHVVPRDGGAGAMQLRSCLSQRLPR